jgi:23S rRNA pseudouridine1911/1915/1917 synthase
MKKNVLFEDNHLLVVNKPTGILTQGDSTGDRTILDFYKEYIKEKYDKPGAVFLAPAHRLDRPVSGCLILCRTSKAASRMTELFKNNEIKKTYLALTNNTPDILEGHLEQYLLKDETTNRTKVEQSWLSWIMS